MEPDFLKQLAGQHNAEQGITGIREFATQVAAFYHELCNDAMEPDAALALADTFLGVTLTVTLDHQMGGEG